MVQSRGWDPSHHTNCQDPAGSPHLLPIVTLGSENKEQDTEFSVAGIWGDQFFQGTKGRRPPELTCLFIPSESRAVGEGQWVFRAG